MHETRAARRHRARVANACDACKQRKIKCTGTNPCSYCARRQQPDSCHYTTPQQPQQPQLQRRRKLIHADPHHPLPSHDPPSSPIPTCPPGSRPTPALFPTTAPAGEPHSPTSRHQAGEARRLGANVEEEHDEHDETEVPREARLLRDPHGKLVFIGDCAPLSFFQTVRRLVTSLVDVHAFAPQNSGYSALENAFSWPSLSACNVTEPPSINIDVDSAVSAYLEITAGMVDLFDNSRLRRDIANWTAEPPADCATVSSAVKYLVLAIGCHDEGISQLYFNYARDVVFASLGGNPSLESIQAFLLTTLHMLGASQINSAFLFFGIAVRAAYSIGIHRTAVNARFGPEVQARRDRLWKSLRVVDLFLSTSMGRPPATSDSDCTVMYREVGDDGRERFDLLHASVQIFLITEKVVLEVYSRRKISPRLTEGLSRQLREWSTRWLHQLKGAIEGSSPSDVPGLANGACRVLSSYYYAVILVSRPFFMVELRSRLLERPSVAAGIGGESVSGKTKLADACVDAAILMVDPALSLIERGIMKRPAPVVVSWLFASSLVLGLGLLGGFGRAIEKPCRDCISALEHFGNTDSHAMQYSLIAKSLLATSLKYLEKKELQERSKRTEISSQLFGLVPQVPRSGDSTVDRQTSVHADIDNSIERVHGKADATTCSRTSSHPLQASFDFESAFLGFEDFMSGGPDFSSIDPSLNLNLGTDQTLGEMNLFPLLESDGHIDLANYI